MFTSGLLLNAEYDHALLAELARSAETLGYDRLWYADERFYRETYIGLAVCAMATSRMQLGPAVTDPYTRHPALTAAAIASLDELSGGRAILGYAAGASGFRNLGLRPERSTVALREAMTIVRALLTGETVTFEGEMVSIWNGQMQFAARPDLPIFLAAWGPSNMRLAGAVADGVIVPHCASPLTFRSHLERIETGVVGAGREHRPEIVVRLDVSVGRDRDAALRTAKVRLARYLWAQYPRIAYLETHGLSLPPELDRSLREAGPFPGGHDSARFAPFVDAIPDELVYPVALAGAPADVAAQARQILATGADEIMAYLLVPEGETIASVIQIYATEVVDALRGAHVRPEP